MAKSNPQEKLSPLKQAIVELRQMRAKVEAMEAEKYEPIAVVGMGCRLPGGADNPAQYWKNLLEGRDGIVEVPKDRWDMDALYDPDYSKPGKIATKWGGFLDRVDLFDPRFFGISPREAEMMDPQQRLVMEVCWEALEDAAIAPDRLSGSRTGVIVGVATNDYATLHNRYCGWDRIDPYYATGSVSHSVCSGRVSYILGLQGPAYTVDTACSSSLVTLHLACQALRRRDADCMLAGGVNLILSPEVSIGLSSAQMMASDGRCKTFDAKADGFVRAEGCGMVTLKRLSDAEADGDRVLAVIRGSAINQDGRSAGITAPNGPSQVQVIQDALRAARLDADQVGYIETHGTGTSLGDPIEVQALGEVFGKRKQPLLIGSAKTNLGHCETAAGIAGFIKLVMAVHNRHLPQQLHFSTPSPHIPWEDFSLEVTAKPREWAPIDGEWIGGVSSFGFSGTNAHVIVSQPPERASAPESAAPELRSAPEQLFLLSGRGDAALRSSAASLLAHVEGTSVPRESVALTLARGRARHSERAAFRADSQETLEAQLQRIANGEASPNLLRGKVDGASRKKIGFLFTGQGSQTPGMGRELYETEPLFREIFDRCDALLKGSLERPLLEVVFPSDPKDETLLQTAYTQPALFALEYALAKCWQKWGVEPRAVQGHSIGEYVAACFAGVFSLEDGLRLIAERAKLMQALPSGGRMCAVFATAEVVQSAVDQAAAGPSKSQASIAAFNGPDTVVISGTDADVDVVLAELEPKGIKSRDLLVSHAFHSVLMEPMLDKFRAVAESIEYKRPTHALISNVTGDRIKPGEINADYWCRHIRQPVQFAKGMQAMAELGCGTFVEIGPSPVLMSLGKSILADDATLWLPTLRRGRNDWSQILDSAAELFVNGYELDPTALWSISGALPLSLPPSPYDRRRFWLEGVGAASGGSAVIASGDVVEQASSDRDADPVAASDESAAEAESSSTPTSGLRAELMALIPVERSERLLALVRGSVAAVLKIDDPASLDQNHGLMDLGLDSLMAVELRSSLNEQLRLDEPLPATLIMDYPTIQAIVGLIEEELFGEDSEEAEAETEEELDVEERARELDEMSDDEAEALLLQKLQGLGGDDA